MKGRWLIPVFLVLGVLAPAICVVWFMNMAAESEAAAARQDVEGAYRGQLRLLRGRADAFWRDRAVAISKELNGSDQMAFARIVTKGLADSAVLTGYPQRRLANTLDVSDDSPEWQHAAQLERMPGHLADAAALYAQIANARRESQARAVAAQANIRCLVRMGDRPAAFAAIQKYFGSGILRTAGGGGERSIAGDEYLLAIRLAKPSDPQATTFANRLLDLVNDYSVGMPSAQRVFLMDQIQGSMPTREAEHFAAAYVSTDKNGASQTAIQKLHDNSGWSLSISGGAVALYETPSVERLTSGLFERESQARGAVFHLFPPGSDGGADAIAAGPMLPGWTMGFTLTRHGADAAGRARLASYLWIGYLVAGCVAISGGLVARWLRREAHLARLKTDLVASVSHELRTPLASTRLLIETLLDEPEPESRRVREYLELMARENQRLTNLVENFLTFSRMERNKKTFIFAPTSAITVIRRAVGAMGDRLQPPACELDIDVNEALVLEADEDALVSAVMNLLDNACKYSREPRRVRVAVSKEGNRIAISVSDNGIGIATGEQKRIFERFYQVDQRLGRETGGCGLGLSIVEFIVRGHGGSIAVESSPGAGSTFRLRLGEVT